MNRASFVGLVAAILLISSLIFGALDVLLPNTQGITICGTATAIGGFALVIVAAFIVIMEGRVIIGQIDDELRDVADLAEGTGGSVERNR